MLNTILKYYQKGFIPYDLSEISRKLKLKPSITSPTSYLGNEVFRFLNIDQSFNQGIDWNFSNHGKLWTYNLNYFEYLSQSEISKHEGLGLMHDFINNEKISKDGMEPFPISLRVIFWIKFLTKHQIDDDNINQSLFRQVQMLSARPEYHLMGNHLLENGFGLLFGAYYFQNKKLIGQAKKILTEQLQEQILPDGAHFELSPMYHQLMLYRVLDSINLFQQNPKEEFKDLENIFIQKAELMLGWLQAITFQNGELPKLNDSTDAIAPKVHQLLDYADRLNVKTPKIKLKESGYRKMKNTSFEMIIDVGQIGPDYIPGHAHSDTFNFVLHYEGKPLIVDTGISTYEKNQKRNQERSTAAHNTVVIAKAEQSEVWGGFRVARRAKVFNLQESKNRISACHDGYRKIHTIHQRTFVCQENSITILDEISNQNKAQAFLHFHPDVEVFLIEQEIHGSFGKIIFDNLIDIEIEPYQWAAGFNKTVSSKKVILTFKENLQTKIIRS